MSSPHRRRSCAPCSTPTCPRVWSRSPAGGGRWWLSLFVCLLLGWLGAVLVQGGAQDVPAALASAWNGLARDGVKPDLTAQARPAAKAEAVAIDSWAVGKPYAPEPAQPKTPEIKVLAVSQLSLKASEPNCDGAAQALVAPNGEPWPQQSGYVTGFPISNKGEDLAVTLDNSANATPVFVKLFDLDRRANVRYLYLLAHDKLVVEQLGAGKYEVRYQAVEPAGEGCGQTGGAVAPSASPPRAQDEPQNPVVSSL